MKYEKVIKGKFISRPNRFIAMVEIDGEVVTTHVKNTGRCKELLVPNCEVWLAESSNLSRKTKYDLICTKKAIEDTSLLINLDSQAPNSVAGEWLKGNLFSSNAIIKREVTYQNSRFDFYAEDEGKKAFLEVKGVTLEEHGVAMFPDAPTERGIKHIRELISAKEQGFDAYILFVIQMKGIHLFTPNIKTHPEFACALKDAKKAGVKIYAVDCNITPESIEADAFVEIKL